MLCRLGHSTGRAWRSGGTSQTLFLTLTRPLCCQKRHQANSPVGTPGRAVRPGVGVSAGRRGRSAHRGGPLLQVVPAPNGIESLAHRVPTFPGARDHLRQSPVPCAQLLLARWRPDERWAHPTQASAGPLPKPDPSAEPGKRAGLQGWGASSTRPCPRPKPVPDHQQEQLLLSVLAAPRAGEALAPAAGTEAEDKAARMLEAAVAGMVLCVALGG